MRGLSSRWSRLWNGAAMKTIRYAVYKGEELLAIGTSYQLAERFNVKRETVKWWASPANMRKVEAGKGNRKVAVRL